MKRKRQVRTIQARIADWRRDRLRKVSQALVDRARQVTVGNVSAPATAKTRMATSVLDAGWSMPRGDLRYECGHAGLKLLPVRALRHGLQPAVDPDLGPARTLAAFNLVDEVAGPAASRLLREGARLGPARQVAMSPQAEPLAAQRHGIVVERGANSARRSATRARCGDLPPSGLLLSESEQGRRRCSKQQVLRSRRGVPARLPRKRALRVCGGAARTTACATSREAKAKNLDARWSTVNVSDIRARRFPTTRQNMRGHRGQPLATCTPKATVGRETQPPNRGSQAGPRR